jgi:hypothetical protein
MTQQAVSTQVFDDALLIKLARELAIELNDIETILQHNQIDIETWNRIKDNPRFKSYYEQERSQWHSALNTNERVKVKSASIVEEFLLPAYTALNDPKEALNSKIELFKHISRLAGMGVTGANVAGEVGEKFSVTINIGKGELKFEKEKIIEGEAL